MDHMLPSPGFSIPSIGTPLHQPEEDQQIIANNSYPQYAPQMAPPPQMGGMNSMSANTNMMSLGSGGGGGSGMSGMHSSVQNMSGGLPSLMHTPNKMMHSYQPSYSTPQSMMQPQTPVSCNLGIVTIKVIKFLFNFFFVIFKQQSLMSPMVPMTERSENIGSVNVHQMMGPATPMTPMTPGSADPGIVPQLQYYFLDASLTFQFKG